MEVHFRNLAGRPLEQGLGRLLEEVLSGGRRAIVIAGSAERVEALDLGLWTFDPASFLPHAAAGSGDDAAGQPVLLTTGEEAGNGATVAVVVDGVEIGRPERFDLVHHMFDRQDAAAREAARLRWKKLKDAGAELSYWEFGQQGWRRGA